MPKRLVWVPAIVIALLALLWFAWPKTYVKWNPDRTVAVSICDQAQGSHNNICRLVFKHAWWDILYPALYLGITESGVFEEARWSSNDRVVIVGERLEKSLTDRPIKRGDIRFHGVEVVWVNR